MLPSLHFLTRRRFIGSVSALALTVLGAASLYAVATDSDAGQLLASELPAGVTLSTASNEQVITATRRAVRREPKMAVSVVRVAIVAKTPRRRLASSDGKSVVDRSKDAVCPPCDLVVGVARAGIEGAADQASRIVEEASALCPSCASELSNLLNDPGLGYGMNGPFDSPYGFGTGFGPGFPGSPGFFGSPPGGVLGLTPTLTDVSPIVNP